jgi:hypothetical protein
MCDRVGRCVGGAGGCFLFACTSACVGAGSVVHVRVHAAAVFCLAWRVEALGTCFCILPVAAHHPGPVLSSPFPIIIPASSCLAACAANQGYKGLFAGWNSSLVQDCAFSATQFLAYERVRWRSSQAPPLHTQPPTHTLP